MILTVVPTNAMYSDDCKHTANVSLDFSEDKSAIPRREENVVNHYRSYLSLFFNVKYDYILVTLSSVYYVFAFK